LQISKWQLMAHESQQDRALALLREQGMARLSELAKAGITAATISRMKERGLILQLGRGCISFPMPPLTLIMSWLLTPSSYRRGSCV
jgi:hypothetical protein